MCRHIEKTMLSKKASYDAYGVQRLSISTKEKDRTKRQVANFLVHADRRGRKSREASAIFSDSFLRRSPPPPIDMFYGHTESNLGGRPDFFNIWVYITVNATNG